MTKRTLALRRRQLEEQLARSEATTASLDAEVRTASGRTDGGNLSNVPLHLGDLGSDTFSQELSTVLLENTTRMHEEALQALKRMDAGTYGICERCHRKIADERLEAIPDTRYCAACAKIAGSTPIANFNEGAQTSESEVVESGATGRSRRSRATGSTRSASSPSPDRHAAGTPGGGSAIGGLAGTNADDGDPADANLEEAMGSGHFDAVIDGTDDESEGYAGPSGGAVGGTPAGKRARGGRRKPR